jgi:hypothetical protein
MPDALTLNINVSESGSGRSTGGVGGRGLLGAVAQGAGMGAGFGAFNMVAGAIQKGLEGSPMFQGMSKLMNTAVEQILRPIGDVVGTLIRPMAISLIKMSTKWLEWMTTVDGKAFMQIIQGIGEILGGIAQGIIGGIIGLTGGGWDMFEQGKQDFFGGIGRIGIAASLMGEKGEAASMALDRLASMDTEDITRRMGSLGITASGVANELLGLAEATIRYKNALSQSKDSGDASSILTKEGITEIQTTDIRTFKVGDVMTTIIGEKGQTINEVIPNYNEQVTKSLINIPTEGYTQPKQGTYMPEVS